MTDSLPTIPCPKCSGTGAVPDWPKVARRRSVYSISIPKDELEDGSQVLKDLIQAGREAWGEQLGWSGDVPAYFVIAVGMAKALQS